MLLDFVTHPKTELMATICFVIHVVLSAKGNIWCWASGFLTSFLYTFIFLGVYLSAQVTLNVLYMVMAIWGWAQWSENGGLTRKSRFSYCPYWLHLLGIITVAGVITLSVLIVPSAFQHELIYLDATVTVGGIFATILTIYRKIECWLYWIIINALTFFLYSEEGLTQTAILSVVVSLLSVYGFINWRDMRQHELKYGIIDDE